MKAQLESESKYLLVKLHDLISTRWRALRTYFKRQSPHWRPCLLMKVKTRHRHQSGGDFSHGLIRLGKWCLHPCCCGQIKANNEMIVIEKWREMKVGGAKRGTNVEHISQTAYEDHFPCVERPSAVQPEVPRSRVPFINPSLRASEDHLSLLGQSHDTYCKLGFSSFFLLLLNMQLL